MESERKGATGKEENLKATREIRCPYCHKVQEDDGDGDTYPVSYFGTGEENPIVMACDYCERKFEVEEHVKRTYSVHKIEGEE